MSFKRLQKDNIRDGDLGLSNMPTISIEDLPVIAPHVANILAHLEKEGHRVANYCFVFWKPLSSNYTHTIIERTKEKLPANVVLYEVDGNMFFDIKQGEKQPVTKQCCYLIQKG